MSSALTKKMNAAQAKKCADRIRRGAEDVMTALIEFHDGEGWSALGYESFSECVSGEFDMSRTHAHRLIRFGEIKAIIDQKAQPMVARLTEGAARETGSLPPNEAANVIMKAAKANDGVASASVVKAAMNNIGVAAWGSNRTGGEIPKPQKLEKAKSVVGNRAKPTRLTQPKPPPPTVPAALQDVASGEYVKATVTTLNRVIKGIKREANTRYGPWMTPIEDILSGLNFARNKVADLAFGEVCKECGGAGKPKCCRSTGWIPEWRKLEIEAGD